jgi:hypothetical protein
MPTLSHLKPLIERKSGSGLVSCAAAAIRLHLGYDTLGMRRNGYDPSIIEEHQTFNDRLEVFLAHPLVGEYLSSLTPQQVYQSSGVRVLPLAAIKDEIQQLAPGALLFPLGYLPFATSIGGNAICFHVPTGRVVWADHDIFCSGISITYRATGTGAWHTVPFTSENVEKAVVLLADDIAAFLADLLYDKLQAQLDELD